MSYSKTCIHGCDVLRVKDMQLDGPFFDSEAAVHHQAVYGGSVAATTTKNTHDVWPPEIVEVDRLLVKFHHVTEVNRCFHGDTTLLIFR